MIRPLPVQQTLIILGVLLQEKAVQVGVANMSWPQLAKMHMIGGAPRFAYLVKPVLGEDAGEAGAWLIDALMAVEPSERREIPGETHSGATGARAGNFALEGGRGQAADQSSGWTLSMAVEIGNRMQSELGVSIPPVKFMEGLTTAGMAQYLVEQLTGDRAAAAATRPGPAPAQVAALAAAAKAARMPVPGRRRLWNTCGAAKAGVNGHSHSGPQPERVEAAVSSLSDHEVDSLLKRLSEEQTATAEEEEEEV